MKARSHYRADAVVLGRFDYGESDRIVTFYTDGFGKLRGIAKGARRSQRRFANALEPFCLSRILFSRRGRDGLALIESCDVIDHHARIRSNLDKNLMASYLIELTDHFTLEGKENPALFELLQDFLLFLNQQDPSDHVLRIFEMRLLRLTGYEPVLDRCLVCQAPLNEGNRYGFIVAEGGIQCDHCRWGGTPSLPASLGTLRTLLLGQDMAMERIGRLVPSGTVAEESGQILAAFLRHLLGRELKTLQVLRQIRGLGCS